jgi:hypothetical protein
VTSIPRKPLSRASAMAPATNAARDAGSAAMAANAESAMKGPQQCGRQALDDL